MKPVISSPKYKLNFVLQIVTCVVLVGTVRAPALASLSTTELKCTSQLAKTASKLAGTYLRDMGRCRDSVIKGKISGPCPDSSASAHIDGAVQKLEATIAKTCSSTCEISGTKCIANSACPPNGAISELCSAGAKDLPFDIGNLGFPGAQCELAIGKPMTTTRDLADCVSTLTQRAGDAMIGAIYGNVDGTVTAAADMQRCLGAISKSTQKLLATVYKGVIKCRSGINKGKKRSNPALCSFEDPKILAKTGKAKTKLRSEVEKRCDSPQVLGALNVCGQPAGTMLSTTDIASCIIAAASELADSLESPAQRVYSPTSFLDSVYPPAQVCGDNMVNQAASAFLPLGEECDGIDDSECPGLCLPPGDLFECTCADRPRLRFLGDGNLVDLDIGWGGAFHDLRIANGAGFVADVSSCDCSDMDGAACSGTSANPVCNLQGRQLPRCEWDLTLGTPCDAHGNSNFKNDDSDCFACDAFADNSGEYCRDSSDCQSRCYDVLDTPGNQCTSQDDCSADATCRGRCDDSFKCIEIPNGAPTPSSSDGLGACTLTVYRNDVTGTTDIKSGQHEIEMLQNSRVHLGQSSSTPCPVCGGFCDGGPLDGEACLGRCTFGMAPCRSDDDCRSGNTCDETSPDCQLGECNLSLVCSAGANKGRACRVESVNGIFGAVSSDCPPTDGQNITGAGLGINWSPRTSEFVGAPGAMPCTAAGFELYTCPCAPAGGASTKPNACAAACDAGAEFGQGCGTGNSPGVLTTCSGGTNDLRACDDEADCPDGSCSNNPTHCVGDPAFDLNLCTTDGDCGLGSCVDACPAGRCVPLCKADPGDADDGVCAAGPPTYHCSGFGDLYRACGAEEANGNCAAQCNKTGGACKADTECPAAEQCEGTCDLARLCEAGTDGILGTSDDIPGAGICIADDRQCPRFGIEGGDIGNGWGDPINVRTVAAFCLSGTGSPAVNEIAGIGGPGRLRQFGTNVTNGFETLP